MKLRISERPWYEVPVIKMGIVRPKLKRLMQLMPNNPHPLMYPFGQYMASIYYSDEDQRNAAGINIGFMYAITGLSRGVCDRTHLPLTGPLIGHHSEMYGKLLIELPNIYDVVLPKGVFLEETKELFYAYLLK